MYKVFFNESLLTFDQESKPKAKNILYHHESNFDEAFHLLSSSAANHVNIISESLEEVWNQFKNYFKLIQAAGGIVRNPKDEYLFIYRLGKWDLPKGKMEEGETKDMSRVIAAGLEYGKMTEGRFDIAIGAVTKQWDFHSGGCVVPDGKTIEDALKHTDATAISQNQQK